MAVSSVASRSRDGKITVRSRRRGPSSRQHSSTLPEEGEAIKPDIDELRQRRAAYFARPVAERQKIIRSEANHASSTGIRSSTSGDSERRRKKKSHSSRSDKASGRTNAEGDVIPSGDYVYEAPSAARNVEPDHEHRIPSTSTQKRRHSRHGASHRAHRVDKEVTLENSVSTVAEPKTTSSKDRPALKRSSTTSSKLAPIREAIDAPSAVSSPRASKRESTLLGGLLRRQPTSAVPTAPRLVECLTCGSDDVPHARSAKLACRHRMCHECLKRIFNMSVTDPAHMPPRCCTDDHIPLKHVDKLFDLQFKLLWNKKYQEYNTKNRVYCPAPKCGEWIKPTHIHRNSEGKKYAQCPRCKVKVCVLCNNKMHRNKECPKDPEIAKLVDQAKKEGWQRCFSCSSMVELKEGCNHMTCRCLAEFCMVCGSKWKTCECPLFAYSDRRIHPNPDALNEWRLPEPIQVLHRRIRNVYNPGQPQQVPRLPEQPPAARAGELTYEEEMAHRRRQERSDSELARRLQLASLMENDDRTPVPARQPTHIETWGLGNAAEHFLNDDFVQNAANVVMSAFGDANMGRRGERASGRRRRAAMPEQPAGETGLVANFLGDESVLGMPPSRPGRAPA